MITLIPECIGIIPARYASQRFPGKPLADILGRPMFWHVYQRACRSSHLKRVILATDDKRIFKAAQDLDVPVVMTRNDHPSGSDRILEAARELELPRESVIVNIQGDEPALEPVMIDQLLEPFVQKETEVTTLARSIDQQAAANPNLVKVVFSQSGQALYFSRNQIPHLSIPPSENTPFYGHIGLYAYRKHILERFVHWGPSRLENLEKLEQLRLLEHGIPIRVVVTEHSCMGVDTPQDLAAVTQLMATQASH